MLCWQPTYQPPLPAPRFPRKDFLRPSEMSDLRSQRQFLWSQKLFHFTLFQRKKCTKYHFISNILLQICTFQNVYEQRQYWCSINAIAPRYFILKSFSTKIQKSFFFFLQKFKKERQKGHLKCWPSIYHSRNQKPKFQTNIRKTIYILPNFNL